jgi:hypothetical protein
MTTDVLSKFDELGLKFNKPNLEQVELPTDITILSSEQLAEKFTALTAWADYIASQHAVAIIEERAAQRALDLAENRMLVARFGSVKGERITFVKAQISVDDTIVELGQNYEEKYAYRKLLEMLLNNHERDLTLVSREITRRTNDQRAFRKDYGV